MDLLRAIFNPWNAKFLTISENSETFWLFNNVCWLIGQYLNPKCEFLLFRIETIFCYGPFKACDSCQNIQKCKHVKSSGYGIHMFMIAPPGWSNECSCKTSEDLKAVYMRLHCSEARNTSLLRSCEHYFILILSRSLTFWSLHCETFSRAYYLSIKLAQLW